MGGGVDVQSSAYSHEEWITMQRQFEKAVKQHFPEISEAEWTFMVENLTNQYNEMIQQTEPKKINEVYMC